jgi:single-stranded-DNA-specific exonuclease
MTENSERSTLNWNLRGQSEIPPEIDVTLRRYSAFLRLLLFNRGFFDAESAASFIAGEVNFPTDPLLIKDMQIAIDQLHAAVINGERIAVYGDYDADGVTATALMAEFLSSLGVDWQAYIPNRYDEGYGLNDDAIQTLAEEGVKLVITVDCGVRSIREVELAVQLGMAVIITDHHQPGKTLPPAAAVINPRQPGDIYPEKDLAGVGLAYKLAQAYLAAYPQADVDPEGWLDLVAIGTVADLAQLTGENRLLVKQGLARIRQQPRLGLMALASISGLNLEECDSTTIGFGLGPRLNAAGRMDTAMSAYELLIAQDQNTAVELAQVLDSQNRQRQEDTHAIRELAIAQVLQTDPDALLFFAADPGFSEGVVGLAASRLTESYYRPAIIAHQGEDFTVASCRSIPEFHITRALDECAELLVRHGGHAAAAGFTVSNQNLPILIDKLYTIAERELAGKNLSPVALIDKENDLTKFKRQHQNMVLAALEKLEPTGRGNPKPLFASRNVKVLHATKVGKDGKHLKLSIEAADFKIPGIAFQQGHWADKKLDRIDIIYRFEKDNYHVDEGRVNLQLNIKDLRPSDSQEDLDADAGNNTVSV